LNGFAFLPYSFQAFQSLHSFFLMGEVCMRCLTVFVFLFSLLLLNGCILTKVVTVPMRLGGAVISIIPAVGNSVHDAIDEAAEIVDEVPI
jgi:hypothetical protein